MRPTAPLRLLTAIAAAGTLGVAVAAGLGVFDKTFLVAAQSANGANPVPGASGPPENKPRPPSSHSPTPTRTPSPKVTLPALKQPTKAFPTPKLPKAPNDETPELTRLSYSLEAIAWKSSGVVDTKAKTNCGISESKLAERGEHEFTCDVMLTGGVTVRYEIQADVGTSEVESKWKATYLPMSLQKATYELTRQAYKPAKVDCPMDELKLVKVGQNDGLKCTAVDINGASTTYLGELLNDGSLIFRMAK